MGEVANLLIASRTFRPVHPKNRGVVTVTGTHTHEGFTCGVQRRFTDLVADLHRTSKDLPSDVSFEIGHFDEYTKYR